MNVRLSLGVFMALALVTLGCTSSSGGDDSTTTTQAATTTTAAPSTTTTAEAVVTTAAPTTTEPASTTTTAASATEVTFDGDGCSLGDTTEVAAGDYAFVMTSSVSKAVDVAVQPVPHDTTWDEYAAANSDLANGLGEAAASFAPLPDDLTDNQRARRYIVNQGDHGIWAIRLTPPTGVWLCGRLTVSE